MFIIDRFEGSFAICENDDKRLMEIPVADLPKGAKEGSALEFINGVYVLNQAAEQLRRDRIKNLEDSLWE